MFFTSNVNIKKNKSNKKFREFLLFDFDKKKITFYCLLILYFKFSFDKFLKYPSHTP